MMSIYGSADLGQAEAVKQFPFDHAPDFTAVGANALDISSMRLPATPDAPAHHVFLSRERRPASMRRFWRYA